MLDNKNFEAKNVIIMDGIAQYVLRVYQFEDAASIYIGISVKRLLSKVYRYDKNLEDKDQQINGIVTLIHPEDESKNQHKEIDCELDLKKFISMKDMRSQGFIKSDESFNIKFLIYRQTAM